MTTENPTFIGEGTYGCVARPSLTCENSPPNLDYTNKVSKLMTKKHALKELDKYKTVLNIPGVEKYLIPKPHFCKPSDTATFREFFSHCQNKKLQNPDAKLRLLILEDGGISLENVVMLLPKMSAVDFKLFVCSWGKIIDAVCFLAKHKIIHHDLKLGNIVYNVQTGDLKFIDFGKVTTMSNFVLISSDNQNNEGTSWFNYPVETQCANKSDFLEKGDCAVFRDSMEYDAFIRKAAMTFDMYSIGLVFKELVELIFKFHELTENPIFQEVPMAFFQDCKKLGEKMSDPELKKRVFSPCKFQESFAKICKTHQLTCSAPNKLSTALVKKLETVEHVICRGRKKTWNPFTNKCVNKCAKGFYRKKVNTRKFKCVKGFKN